MLEGEPRTFDPTYKSTALNSYQLVIDKMKAMSSTRKNPQSLVVEDDVQETPSRMVCSNVVGSSLSPLSTNDQFQQTMFAFIKNTKKCLDDY